MVEISEEEYKEYMDLRREKEERSILEGVRLKTDFNIAALQFKDEEKYKKFQKAEKKIFEDLTEARKEHLSIKYDADSDYVEFISG